MPYPSYHVVDDDAGLQNRGAHAAKVQPHHFCIRHDARRVAHAHNDVGAANGEEVGDHHAEQTEHDASGCKDLGEGHDAAAHEGHAKVGNSSVASAGSNNLFILERVITPVGGKSTWATTKPLAYIPVDRVGAQQYPFVAEGGALSTVRHIRSMVCKFQQSRLSINMRLYHTDNQFITCTCRKAGSHPAHAEHASKRNSSCGATRAHPATLHVDRCLT